MRPKYFETYNENRKKVCTPCESKISNTRGKIKLRTINERECRLIQLYLDEKFDTENKIYLIGLCSTCRVYLGKAEKGLKCKFQIMPKYGNIIIPKSTRKKDNPKCNCFICLKARDKTRKFIEKEHGVEKKCFTNINNSTGLFTAATENKLPKTSVKKRYILTPSVTRAGKK